MPAPLELHSCWFGPTEPPEIVRRCRESWGTYAGEFRHTIWTRVPDDIKPCEYLDHHLEAGNWAFVSDYVQAWLLLTRGGIYVDSDVELRRPLGLLNRYRAFSGFETPGLAFTAVWGSEPGHPWPERAVAAINSFRDIRDPEPNTRWMSRLLTRHFAINPRSDTFQVGTDDVAIFPSSVFCRDTAESFSVHHFSGSWKSEATGSYKQVLDERTEVYEWLEANWPATSRFGRHLRQLGSASMTARLAERVRFVAFSLRHLRTALAPSVHADADGEPGK